MKRFVKVISLMMAALIALFSVSALAAFSVTTTASVNLRTGPGTEYATQGCVPSGVTLSVDETAKATNGKTWYHVNYSGKNGWICSSYTKDGGSAEKKVVTSGDANIRTGAGLDYKSVGVMPKGATAKYMNESKKDDRGVTWYRINYNGTTGWVSSKYAAIK
ncbi:MAG: SH3 domain-containing protein [Clostridia bacterium]|nr:SH3 domain-containing protein [Clostridia bacterium]